MKYVKDFLMVWGKQFYNFMWDWGLEIIRASVYSAMAIAFVCVVFQIPVEALSPVIFQLFGIIIGMALTINIVVSCWYLFHPDYNEDLEETASPANEVI